ncbi:MAG TPA: hypothetical protein VGU26_03440 [Gaiellaceae bacterium]|nr:hypothetical protein [Gaiellaceae bacterium]
MRRRKRHIAGLVALGLAVVATVPAMAKAEPSPYVLQSQTRQPMELGLSEGKIRALGLLEQSGMKSLDDRSFPQSPYVSQTRQPMELGLSEGKMRALGLLEQSGHPTPVVSDGNRTIDVNAYSVTGFGVAFLFAIAVGMGLAAVWHRRGTRLSPA